MVKSLAVASCIHCNTMVMEQALWQQLADNWDPAGLRGCEIVNCEMCSSKNNFTKNKR